MNWRRFNPFRRKEEVSPEFSSYYQSADTNSQSNSAILLGFVTLLAAILLVFGLFIGGRAIYNKLTDKKDDKVTVSDEAAKNNNASNNSASTNSSSNNSSDNKPAQIPGGDTTSSTPSTTATQGASTTLPQTGVESIPRTGVEE